jgi:hypothetical protein
MIDCSKILTTIKENKESQLKNSIAQLDRTYNNLLKRTWTQPKHFLFSNSPRCTYNHDGDGVYLILYHVENNTYKLFYVGQGNISKRKSVHKAIFNNKGNPKMYHTKSSSTASSNFDSPVGRKMYEKCTDRTKWYFAYLECPKEWATNLEEHIMSTYSPEGNDEKMSGKS